MTSTLCNTETSNCKKKKKSQSARRPMRRHPAPVFLRHNVHWPVWTKCLPVPGKPIWFISRIRGNIRCAIQVAEQRQESLSDWSEVEHRLSRILDLSTSKGFLQSEEKHHRPMSASITEKILKPSFQAHTAQIVEWLRGTTEPSPPCMAISNGRCSTRCCVTSCERTRSRSCQKRAPANA